MEDLSGAHIDGVSNTIRRKRSQTSRRPPPDSQPAPANREFSPSSSTPTSDDASKVSSDENPGYYNISSRKESNFHQFVKRVASAGESEFESTHKDCTEQEQFSSGRDPANWKGSSNSRDSSGKTDENQHVGPSHMSSDILENENKVKKVKLKVCGVLHTIQTNLSSNGTLLDGSSSLSPNISQEQQSLNLQENSSDNHSFPDKKSGLRGIPWKDFSVGFNLKKDSSMGKMKHVDKSEAVRKSKRVPKKRVMHGAFDDDDEDDEIRYLEKLKTIKFTGGYKGDEERCGKKQRSVSKNLKDIGSPSGKLRKKLKSDEASEDTDYEEEDPNSDGELEGSKKKKPKKESIQLLMEGKRELSLTTRQRALQSGKEASAAAIEFPNGLPTAPSRKQKEKLSEVEQQLKKAEAAQRRRMQVEKAARESEAEAIRKILGQDSSRKKREDKMKKRREELAQEKTANALMLASNTVRWIMGPAGTTVTFPNDMGLPEIFDAKPFSYPPPREKCAGPSCHNPYRYRDSKSKLPLCSLECYKAVQGKVQAEATY